MSKTQQQTILDFNKVHNKLYDYSNVIYKSSKDKVRIICKIHGEFTQSPNNHLKGKGCPKCSINNVTNKNTKTTEKCIEDFIKVHGSRYDYSKVQYINAHKKVIILCDKHGEFNQSPEVHRRGSGCPICNKIQYCDKDFYKNKKTTFYIIKVNNLFKPGITIRSIKDRYIQDDIDYEILYEEVFKDGSDAWDKEQFILEETFEFKYNGPKILKGGNTELRIKLKGEFNELCSNK